MAAAKGSNLLIGGSGFVGSVLAQALIDQGETVNSVAREKGEVGGVNYVVADLAAEAIPAPLVEKATDVFVLIGQVGPSFDPAAEHKLLEKVVRTFASGKQRVFYFSSVLVYGECQVPATEADSCQPIGDYPRFKLDSEALIQKIISPDRLVILRLSNLYGSPKNRGFIGFLLSQVADPQKAIEATLNGDGKPRRDYIFIDDAIKAIIKIKLSPKSSGIINIATGKDYSLKELVAIIEKVFSKNISCHLSPELPSEAKNVLVSNSKLRTEYGFNEFTPLEKGLKKTITRYRLNS